MLMVSGLLVFITNSRTYAQEVKIEFTYKHYDIYDGLAQMQVMSLYQDNQGYLWCSTKAGLSRFDGRNFKNITAGLNSLGGSDIYQFGENTKGELLIFGPAQASVVKGDSIIQLSYPEGVKNSSIFNRSKIYGLHEIRKTGNSNQVLTLNYENLDSMFLINNQDKSGEIIHFDKEDKNRIWQSDSLNIYISDWRENKVLETLANPNKINRILQNKNMIFGTNASSEIYKYNGEEFELIVETGFENRYFKTIPTPNNDGFIIKTDKDLYLFKDELIPIKRNLTFIRDILFDNEENLWVATEEGLYNFFQLNFVNYTFGMGNKDWVWSVLEDDENNFWFASYQNGLWKWDEFFTPSGYLS